VLILYPEVNGEITPEVVAAAVWIDLLDPTTQETALVAAATGLAIPARDQLSEIEHSSRLQVDGQLLRLSAPLLAHAATPEQTLTPVGFLASPERLVTIRYARLRVFETVGARCALGAELSAPGVFVQLLEAIVDRDADLLENIGAELEQISRAIFRTETPRPGQGVRDDNSLRRTLQSVGQIGDRLSELRASLLGVARIVPFALEVATGWLAADHRVRLNAARQDIASLGDYEGHLADKSQFLLDAVLGFINTQQNELFKILTIVSVIGVPPTLVASIYGMNFVQMPELHWAMGYPYALVLIVASAVLPILWFKWMRWW
jgi:magnesium transporter